MRRGSREIRLLPPWLSFDENTRTFSGTPAAGDVGAITINLLVMDHGYAFDYSTFTVTVATANRPPPAPTVEDQTATVGQPFSYQFPAVTDPDGDTVEYLAGASNPIGVGGPAPRWPGYFPAWLSFDENTRTFSGAPGTGDVGAFHITVAALDGTDRLRSMSWLPYFTLTVHPTWPPPAFTAELLNVPPEHDGSSVFTFELRFSEEPQERRSVTLRRAVRDFLLAVDGGTVAEAMRLVRGSNRVFRIYIEPTGLGNVTVALRDPLPSCRAGAAVCTADQRSLSGSVSATISGPASQANTPAAGTPTISGTPQVGEELTASTAGITDADGLENASFAYQWLREDTDIAGATAAVYTVVAADEDKRLKVRVSFTDDAGNAESLTSAATEAAAPRPEPLTASFSGVPAEHDGSRFTFELRFSEEPEGLGFRTVRDALLAAEGGTVKRAKRVTKGSNLAFRIHIQPAGVGDVTVTLLTPPPCGLSGAVCTADGRALSGAATAAIPGPASLSVADAEAREGPGAALEFTVTLSRARHEATRVDYATADGTATAGADYEAAAGTLTFAAGEKERTVSVAVLDDAHDDDGQTLTLALSTPAPAGVVRLGRAAATGTIRNADAIPRAWTARFGRTMAEQVLDAVEGRLSASRHAGAAGSIAGHALTREAGAGALDGRRGASWEAPADAARAPSGHELLAGTALAVSGGDAEGGYGSVWGRGAVTHFEGRADGLTLDGEVASALAGADYAHPGGLRAGLLVSHSRGDGGYRGEDSGVVASTLTGVWPWGGFVAERFSIWGVVGYGAGSLTLTTAEREPLRTDLDLALAAARLRGVLVPAGGGFELAATGDALGLRATTAAAPGLAATEAVVTRLRLGLEGALPVRFAGGSSLTPTVTVAARHDGGDAESGLGLEVGGGLAWADPALRLSVELAGRALVAHADAGYREWGAGGALVFGPGADGRGLSFALRPSWGAEAAAADRLWSGGAAAALAAGAGAGAGGRLETEIGYGLPAFDGGFTATPHAGFALTERAREYRLGWRLAAAGPEAVDLDLGLQATRTEPVAGGREAEHAVGLTMTASW